MIDGGEGTDRINVQAADADVTGFQTESIEEFYVRALGEGNPDVDMSGATGAEQLWNDRSVGGQELTFSDVQNAVTLGLNNVQADGVTTLDYDLDDDATEQTIAANGTGTTHDVSVTGDEAITDATVSVTAESDIRLMDVGFVDVTDLTLTGDADLTLIQESSFASIENVTATGLSTDLDLDIRGQTATADLASIVLGGGDDTLTVDHAQFVAGNELKINLGAGQNTLALVDVAAEDDVDALAFKGDDLSIEGVNTVEFVSALVMNNATGTLDLDGITPTDLTFAGTVDGDATLVVENASSVGSATFEDAVGADNAVNLTAADVDGAFTVAVEDAADFGTLTLAEVTDLTVDGTETAAAGDGDIDTITAGNLENLTLSLGEGDLGITNALTMADLATVTASGKGALDNFEIGAGVEDLATIDLSGLEGGATIDNNAADDLGQALTVKVGEGDVTYTANDNDGESREIFEFVGDDIGTIDLTNFVGGIGGNADRLDFSEFDGVSDIDDLDISVIGGGNTEITANGDQFDGTITVTGVDLSDNAANFIFA